MNSWTFCIYEFPPSLNELLRMHWAKRREAQVRLDTYVDFYARERAHEPFPGAKRKRRVTLHFYWRDKRRRDKDNYGKQLLDALRHNHLLVDDSPEWCEVVTVFDVDRENPRIEITLEEEGNGASES